MLKWICYIYYPSLRLSYCILVICSRPICIYLNILYMGGMVCLVSNDLWMYIWTVNSIVSFFSWLIFAAVRMTSVALWKISLMRWGRYARSKTMTYYKLRLTPLHRFLFCSFWRGSVRINKSSNHRFAFSSELSLLLAVLVCLLL